MSDQKLRDLERRWRETGSVEDEAAYLRERVRVGDLTQERLELAAYCGHEGARAALGGVVSCGPKGASELLADLRSWGAEEVGRAFLVIAEAVLPLWRAVSHDTAERESVEAVVVALRLWIAQPCEARLTALDQAIQSAESATWHPASVAVVVGASAILDENPEALSHAVNSGLVAARWSESQGVDAMRARVCLAALGSDRAVTAEPG